MPTSPLYPISALLKALHLPSPCSQPLLLLCGYLKNPHSAQLPLSHPDTRLSNSSSSILSSRCAAGQLSPAWFLLAVPRLLTKGTLLTPGVPQFPGPLRYRHPLQTLVHATHTTFCLSLLNTPPESACIFSELSRKPLSWQALLQLL